MAQTPTSIPNEALSVYTYHQDSPPLAPADSARHYERRRRRLRGEDPVVLQGEPIEEDEGLVGPSRKACHDNEYLDSEGNVVRDRSTEQTASKKSEAESDLGLGHSDHSKTASQSTKSVTPSQNGTPNFQPLTMSCELDGSQLNLDEPLHPMTSPASQIYQPLKCEPVPRNIPLQAQVLDHYKFPDYRLRNLQDDDKIPLVLVACGSYSPCTYLHLRMFEMGRDAIVEKSKYEIVGGYYSPVGDAYGKRGLAAAHHRVRMCELAVDGDVGGFLMVDAWESLQPEYTRTAIVLDHFDREINGNLGGVLSSDGKTRRKVKIMLLAGGDLIQSFGEPGVWDERDLHHILGYGCLVVERTGSDVWSFLLSHDILWKHRANVTVVKQLIYNDISSTKVRLFVRRGMSTKYLLPDGLIKYIECHKLYKSDEPMGKD